MRIWGLALWGALNLACHLGDLPPFICRSDKNELGLAPIPLQHDLPVAIGFDRKNRVLHTVQPTVQISAENVFGIISFKVNDIDQGFHPTEIVSKAADKPTHQIRSMAMSDDQIILGGQAIGVSNDAVLLVGSTQEGRVTETKQVWVAGSGTCSSVWGQSRAGAAVCGGQLYVWSVGDPPQPQLRRLMAPRSPTGGEPMPVTLLSVSSDGTQIAVGGVRGVGCYGRMDSEAPLRCEQLAPTEVSFQDGWIDGSGAIHMVGTHSTAVRREAGELASWTKDSVPADGGDWSFEKIGALGPCQPLIVGQDSGQKRGIVLHEKAPGIWEPEQVPATALWGFAGDDRDVFLLGSQNDKPALWHRPDQQRVDGRTGPQGTH